MCWFPLGDAFLATEKHPGIDPPGWKTAYHLWKHFCIPGEYLQKVFRGEEGKTKQESGLIGEILLFLFCICEIVFLIWNKFVVVLQMRSCH